MPETSRSKRAARSLAASPEAAAHDITAISAGGEMFSEPLEVVAEAPSHPAPIEVSEPASPIRHEGAVRSDPDAEFLAPGIGMGMGVGIGVGTGTGGFAPGSGQLAEEILEDEDFIWHDPSRQLHRRDRRPRRRDARHSMQSTNLPAISDLLKPGQEILVQIAKEPIAKKGARITSHIALPGRFLVFMPTVNHTGVSRKIESDGERRRLKEILLSEKGDASGGFIVRTAAGSQRRGAPQRSPLPAQPLGDIKTRSESSKSPALIYHDLNLVERILRDQVTDNFSAIWVDTEAEYERVLRFLQRFQPSLIRRVKLYTKETPLFEQFGITEEINKALRSKVWLKSGGSIVINQTEALVAIDINTGKFVGKTARLEDTIVKTNLDAIPEIVRQIRLRDLGGIIIIDFIDMDERKNRNRVMAALEDELKNDRAPSKVLQFNDFGLVAITRKRVKQSLERTLSTTCNVCTGTGMVKSPVTVCNDIYIEMRKMHKHLDRGDVMLRVHPEVVKQLKSNGAKVAAGDGRDGAARPSWSRAIPACTRSSSTSTKPF
jgi:ribonuclease E